MPRAFIRLAALAALLLSAGCASVSATPVGTQRAPPLAADAPVTVYSAEADVHAPYDVLAYYRSRTLASGKSSRWQMRCRRCLRRLVSSAPTA